MKRILIAVLLLAPLPASADPYIGPDGTAARPLNVTGALSSAPTPTSSQPTETMTSIGTTSTNFGAPGTYKVITIQAQAQPMCITFGSGTPTAPSGGVCAVGMYLAAGAFYSYGPNAVPNSQGKAAAAATGGYIWESVQ